MPSCCSVLGITYRSAEDPGEAASPHPTLPFLTIQVCGESRGGGGAATLPPHSHFYLQHLYVGPPQVFIQVSIQVQHIKTFKCGTTLLLTFSCQMKNFVISNDYNCTLIPSVLHTDFKALVATWAPNN